MDRMKSIPIIGSLKFIPYDMIKEHEEQVMSNHGQTVNQIYDRGGLDWRELYCILKDHDFDINIPYGDAEKWVCYNIDKYVKTHLDSLREEPFIMPKLNDGLRTCVINPRNGKIKEINAYFHRWCDESNLIIKEDGSYIIRPYVVGLVEFEDGSIGKWAPERINFTDRGDKNE